MYFARMKSLLPVILLVLSHISVGQYWFGPTVGFHLADHSYQATDYHDFYTVKPDLNFHAGGQFMYVAGTPFDLHFFSVYGEILYERIGKTVRNVPDISSIARSTSRYHFLSVPMNLRVNFAIPRTLVKAYAGGGIKLSYWLGGRGEVSLEEFEEFFEIGYELDYKMRFRQSRAEGDDTKLAMVDANRLQYALQAGGGFTVDVREHSRVVVDFRYTYGHSNMGFNGSPDFQWAEYSENFEYRHHIYAISLGYIFEYDAKLARKGKSTSKLSN